MAQRAPSGGLHPEIELPHEREWTLYHNGFSLCSKKVRVCLDELCLPYASRHVHLIETGAYESCSRHFLAINPGATVPVLLHRGHPVYESHEQIVYAARHAGDRGQRLLGADPALRAEVQRWTDRASLVGDPLEGLAERAGHCIPGLTLPLFAAMLQYVAYPAILKGLWTHPEWRRPLIFALMKRRGVEGVARLGAMRRLIARSRRAMDAHLDRLAVQLEGHGCEWIVGGEFTLADVSWLVLLDRLVEADWAAYFWGEGRRPAVAAYWERLRARPSYRSQVLEMRCPITRRGIEDLRRTRHRDPRLRAALEDD